MKRLPLLLVLILLFGCSNDESGDPVAAEISGGQTSSSRSPLVAVSGSALSDRSSGSTTMTAAPAPPTTSDHGTAGSSSVTSSSTTAPLSATTSSTTAASNTAPSTTTAPITPSAPSITTGDGSNPIAVPVAFLAEATNPGEAKCKFVDLHTVEAPTNPGFVGETLGSEHVDGDTMWEVSFYLMLYANCERQARGLQPLEMYTAEQMVEMQTTVLGINTSHGGFGTRGDIVGGATAEQHGGTLLVGEPSHSPTADDDDDDLWSPHEVARRSASGRQHNDTVGLPDHGGAMVSEKYKCIFGAVSLGASANARMDVILFYGTAC